MSANPYLIHGPALIGFSGGRTSGYLLAQILDAHGGRLPPDVRVVFANTGREHPGTLRFVHEVQTRWLVPIDWVEWRATPAQVEARTGFREWLNANDPGGLMVNAAGFEHVGLNSASGNGEPFAALIALKRAIPNGRQRWCSEFLKILPAQSLAQSWGWELGVYAEPIGLRDDEPPGRVAKAKADAARFGRRTVYPLVDAGVTRDIVRAFWRDQPFDLELPPGGGNCDLCFRKGREIRKRVIRQEPWRARFWIEQEAAQGHTFDGRTSVAALAVEVRRAPELPSLSSDDDDFDVECGLACRSEAT